MYELIIELESIPEFKEDKMSLAAIGLAVMLQKYKILSFDDLKQLGNNAEVTRALNELISYGAIQGPTVKRKVKRMCYFIDSELGDKTEFAKSMLKLYPDIDAEHYYHKINIWSSDKDKKRKNWLSVAGKFVSNDITSQGEYKKAVSNKRKDEVIFITERIIQAREDKLYSVERFRQEISKLIAKNQQYSELIKELIEAKGL